MTFGQNMLVFFNMKTVVAIVRYRLGIERSRPNIKKVKQRQLSDKFPIAQLLTQCFHIQFMYNTYVYAYVAYLTGDVMIS